MTRELLTQEANMYADSAPSPGPGKIIVEVKMDDGWSVSIKEAEKPNRERAQTVGGPSATTQRIFDAIGKNGKDKKSPLERKLGR